MIPWNDEMNALITEHWKLGYSASQSAAVIAKRYDVKVTRNAIIGKRNRMNLKRLIDPSFYRTGPQRANQLAGRDGVADAKRRLERAEAIAKRKATKAHDAEIKRMRAAVKRAEEQNRHKPAAILTTHNRDLVVGLHRNQCRYLHGVVGSPDSYFCQEVKEDGSSYCSTHRKICTVVVPLKIKVA